MIGAGGGHINRKQIWKNGNTVYLSGGYIGCSLVYSFKFSVCKSDKKSEKTETLPENTHSQNLDLGLSFSL